MRHLNRDGPAAATRRRLRADESGQDLAEYGLLVALIAIALIVVMTALGGGIAEFFTETSEVIP